MKKRIYITILFCLLFGMIISQKSFAKYIMQDTLQMSVYIDKTPPVINVVTNGEKESFSKTQTDIVKRTNDIIVNTNDNIKIKTNECYYNPLKPEFDGLDSNNFEGDKVITDEGYYKIIATDTSGNKTEIIILLDKSAPNITVRYFKKGEETAKLNTTEVRQVAAIKKNMAAEQIVAAKEETKEEQEDIDSQENLEVNMMSNDGIMLLSGDWYAGNEGEFRTALANCADVIHIRQSIDFSSPIYINYPVTIVPESSDNALRYGSGGNFIVVQNGGSLRLHAIVVDTNSSGVSGMTAINIQSGGTVTFVQSSIVDGGLGNTGILVNGGANLVLWSCEIVRCAYGINLQANGNLTFATQDGRCNNFWWNTNAVFIDNFYGTCNFNQNISMYDNTNGIVTGNISGNVNVSAGTYRNNYNGINAGGNINVSGGSYYSNTNGIYTNGSYTGKLTMTGGSIYSNSNSAIYQDKANDGGCTILGGSISGQVYLAKNDNYINTNASYPTFTVTPSNYFFKRKLVRTNSNEIANNEISKVTLTPKDSWYKYVDGEYIVLWTGGNVIARYKDFYGNILKQELKNGTIGTNYSITPPNIPGYDLIYTPSNANGTYTQNDIVVDFKYDLVNVAKVNFEDILSGVVSAKYWYNANSESFTGTGTDFTDGTIFENYGFYKVLVTNGVGLQKELTFSLNKDSLRR